jgi:hypothetical protein
MKFMILLFGAIILAAALVSAAAAAFGATIDPEGSAGYVLIMLVVGLLTAGYRRVFT